MWDLTLDDTNFRFYFEQNHSYSIFLRGAFILKDIYINISGILYFTMELTSNIVTIMRSLLLINISFFPQKAF